MCAHVPTTELDALADKCLLYMAHTATLSVTVNPSVESEENLYAESDSDWAVGHSTTGFLLMLAGCPIVYSSKRQPCIALSSTEAEIIAASTTAAEICYVRTLLAEMGLELNGMLRRVAAPVGRVCARDATHSHAGTMECVHKIECS